MRNQDISIDDRFGRLIVIALTFIERRHRYAPVRCDCGSEKIVRASSLLSGDTSSCGCLSKELVRARNPIIHTTHGGVASPEYAAWKDMRRRCSSVSCREYIRYGARGITVCAEWLHDFAAFLAHVGPRPSPLHSIDRIDVDGNYEPGNVRWATKKEQSRNRRDNVFLTVGGETLCIAAWAERTGIPEGTVHSRLRRGWSAECVLGL